MKQDDKLVKAVQAALHRETANLTRKIKRMTEQRDVWRERSMRYRQSLIDRSEVRI